MSEQVKHTPGPWQWAFRDRQVTLVHPHRGWLTVMDFARLGMSGGTFRLATWKGDERENMGGIMRPAHEIGIAQHPDARLIAAAPDLLAACKAALNGGGGAGEWERTREVIRAAVAKVEGPQAVGEQGE